MHKIALLIFFAIAASLSAESTRFSLAPAHPRKIVIGPTPQIELVRAGVVGFELIVPKAAPPAVQFAGQELSDQLSQVFGTRLELKNIPSGDIPAIHLGDTDYAAKLGLDLNDFDRDAFAIRTNGQDILLIGRDNQDLLSSHFYSWYSPRGECATIFAVYDFLERFVGIRYYFPGEMGTVIPKLTDWTLPEIDIYDRPDFLLRSYNTSSGSKKPVRYYIAAADWKSKNYEHLAWFRNRMQTTYIPNCHGLAYLGYVQRFGEKHPEYFAQHEDGWHYDGYHGDLKTPSARAGYLCLSSGIKDEIIADAVSFFNQEPASVRGVCDNEGNSRWKLHKWPYFNIMLNDAHYLCRCPKCWTHFSQGEQAASDFIWQFYADICNAVNAKGHSGYFTTMAYADYRMIPNVEIPENLLVMMATRGPWNEHKPVLRDSQVELLKGWKDKLGHKLWLWTYTGKHYGEFPGVPHSTPKAAAAFIKRIQDYSFGVFFESESDVYLFNYLPFYIYGKLCWDNNADIDSLLHEHAQMMFGPAADKMAEFFGTVERHWMTMASNTVDTAAGPKTVFPSELHLWTEIYSSAELRRINTLFNAAEKLAAAAPEHLRRVQFIRQEFFGPLQEVGNLYHEANDSASRWTAWMPEIDSPIAIDGVLDDSAWRNSRPFHLSPLNATPAEVSTIVRVLRDKDNFYFAFECEEPAQVVARERPHDHRDTWRDSDVEIFISPLGNREEYYQILVNAAGSMHDLKVNLVTDNSWESKAEVRTAITPGEKWIAEIRVPRDSYGQTMTEAILAEFARHRVVEGAALKSAYYCWSPLARKFGDISRFGRLTFAAEARINLIADGDFADPTPKLGWGLGRWSVEKNAYLRDETCFVTAGASIRLEGPVSVYSQVVTFKPDTDYVLSFFLRMQEVRKMKPKWCGVYVRVEDGVGGTQGFPPTHGIALDGTCEWRRFEHRFRTSSDLKGKNGYLAFVLRDSEGTAWFDNIKLFEAEQDPK